jgi:integrase
VTALLDAAAELDGEDRSRRRYRRALLATLAFAGLRVGELLSLRWADVKLASGKIRVRQSKTDAGVRTVDVQPELRDELLSWKASTRHGEPSDFVFPTSTGRADNRNNVRRRVLVRAVERANERIAERGGCEPLPDKLAPHALRRTFASWLIAEGEDAAYVMDQLGHADSKMTLDLYARALKSKRRRPHARRGEQAPDRVLDAAVNGHAMGTNAADAIRDAEEQLAT